VIGLFKQKTPANIFVLFVLGVLIKLPLFRNATKPVIHENDAFFYGKIIEFLNSLSGSAFFFASLTYALLFTQALQLNKLINDQRMTQKTTFLPAAAYLLCTSIMPDWNVFSAPLLVNSLVLLVFNGLFKIHDKYSIKGTVFNIGLAIGISSFIFFPSVVFFVWLIFGLLVMRPVRFNEWLICLVGVTTPFYFYAAYLLINNQWSIDRLVQPFTFNMPDPDQSFWLAASGLLLVIPFLIGGYYVQENLRRMLIQVRKSWSLLLIYLMFALFIPFLNNNAAGFQNWILIAIPFAAFHSCAYLYPPQRWFSVIIFWVTILFILAYQYGAKIW
jgi:hypothetical protein